MGFAAFRCPLCGAPADGRALSGERSRCSVCGKKIWSLARTCVHCHNAGYPALAHPDRRGGPPARRKVSVLTKAGLR